MKQTVKIETVLSLFTSAVTQPSDTQADMQDGKPPWQKEQEALRRPFI